MKRIRRTPVAQPVRVKSLHCLCCGESARTTAGLCRHVRACAPFSANAMATRNSAIEEEADRASESSFAGGSGAPTADPGALADRAAAMSAALSCGHSPPPDARNERVLSPPADDGATPPPPPSVTAQLAALVGPAVGPGSAHVTVKHTLDARFLPQPEDDKRRLGVQAPVPVAHGQRNAPPSGAA